MGLSSKVGTWALIQDFNAKILSTKWTKFILLSFQKFLPLTITLPKITLPYIRKVPDLTINNNKKNHLTNYFFRGITF